MQGAVQRGARALVQPCFPQALSGVPFFACWSHSSLSLWELTVFTQCRGLVNHCLPTFLRERVPPKFLVSDFLEQDDSLVRCSWSSCNLGQGHFKALHWLSLFQRRFSEKNLIILLQVCLLSKLGSKMELKLSFPNCIQVKSSDPVYQEKWKRCRERIGNWKTWFYNSQNEKKKKPSCCRGRRQNSKYLFLK